VLRQLLPTVLIPWLAATTAAAFAGCGVLGVAFVSSCAFVASLGGSWHTMRERERQRALGYKALERVQRREAEAIHAGGVLHAELTQLRHEVTNPRTDARRERLRALSLGVELGIGDRRVPVRLRDLTLTDMWLELPRTESASWLPGLPVRVSLHYDGKVEILGWAVADRPLRLPPESPPTWCLRWRDPLREDELPKDVWRAMMDRQAHRVKPHPEARAWVHIGADARPALISNVSATGIGLTMPLGLREAGRLDRQLIISLRLPEVDDALTLACELVHLDVRTAGTALGLRLDPKHRSFGEVQPKLAAHVMRRETRDRVRLVS